MTSLLNKFLFITLFFSSLTQLHAGGEHQIKVVVEQGSNYASKILAPIAAAGVVAGGLYFFKATRKYLFDLGMAAPRVDAINIRAENIERMAATAIPNLIVTRSEITAQAVNNYTRETARITIDEVNAHVVTRANISDQHTAKVVEAAKKDITKTIETATEQQTAELKLHLQQQLESLASVMGQKFEAIQNQRQLQN